jgi:transcriptional regulator with XRE-family HTH domain
MERNFGKILREELDYQGLTVKELALKSAVAKGALDTYLGKQASMPPADAAVRIAAALGVTGEYLGNGLDSDTRKDTPFYSSPGKRVLLRLYDELQPEEQKLTLDFVRLLRKRRINNEAHLVESDF